MNLLPKIAIIYLSYHSEQYLDDVLTGLKRLTYPKEHIEFIVVDNPHPEFGSSMRALEDTFLPLSGTVIPHVTLLPQTENIGFSAGNNRGIAWALRHGFDYVYLHNDDGFVSSGCLEPLIAAFEADKTVGEAQSLVLLHPETDLVNSAGNYFHYLGFGFCGEYRTPLATLAKGPVSDIAYASGASTMLRADLLRTFGLWDEDFFLYHEDLEYSFRLRMAGYRIVLVRDSFFYHKYQFNRSTMKLYWMERNRYGIMLMFFRLPTLVLFLPIALALEVGLVLFAIRGGWFKIRLAVYHYWLSPAHWSLWWQKRCYIQKIRKIRDLDLLRLAVGGIFFQEKKMESPLLTYIGNPLMIAYYSLLKAIIWW